MACAVVAVALAGCGPSEVSVQIPEDITGEVDRAVVAGSMTVGEVTDIQWDGDVRIAHVVLEPGVGEGLLREGVVAWIEQTDRGALVVLDASQITQTPLPRGATLIARRRTAMDTAEAAASRWAGNGTLWVVGVGVAAFIVIILGARIMLRSLAGLILIIVSLAMAAFVALLANDVAAGAVVTWIYPYIGDGGQQFAAEYGLPAGIAAGLADPRVVAVFLVGLPAFVIIAALLRAATRSAKGSSA